jgi:NADP-dependent 3-hydroxy acid dehydrogenase YdfG
VAGKLEGKVALVTGASSGIGEATALALAAEGVRVAVAARRTGRLEALVKRIANSGEEAMEIVTDVGDDAQAHEMVVKTLEKWGRVDILVNSAGVMFPGTVIGADTEEWRRMVNTNLLGLMYATHAVLPVMKAQGRGHIVNISSTGGRTTGANFAVYCATKWGVGAFSEALRQEVCKDNIRVTVIEPGPTATELSERIANPEAKEKVKAWLQSITPLESEDVAASVVYAVTQPERVNVNEILMRPTNSVAQ